MEKIYPKIGDVVQIIKWKHTSHRDYLGEYATVIKEIIKHSVYSVQLKSNEKILIGVSEIKVVPTDELLEL